jgi:hypothetical protein
MLLHKLLDILWLYNQCSCQQVTCAPVVTQIVHNNLGKSRTRTSWEVAVQPAEQQFTVPGTQTNINTNYPVVALTPRYTINIG